jgi:hypothetical protein
MDAIKVNLAQLAAATAWAYRAAPASAAEAAAWSTLALAAWGELDAATKPAAWLADIQQGDGSVGVFADELEPRWPTSLAVLAWTALNRSDPGLIDPVAIERAVQWCLNDRGKSGPRHRQVGHDPSILGWSWAANTSPWLEPSCYHALALTTAGHGEHPRVFEGRRLILDRLLPGGGANYGNSIVLDQQLLAHVAPTGIALVALADHPPEDDRIGRSLEYLASVASGELTPVSLSWAVLGLAAHGRRPARADGWIATALTADVWQPLAAYERALLLLAARPRLDWLGADSPHLAEAAS